MKIKLNSINLVIPARQVNISLDFISNDSQLIKNSIYSFNFRNNSIDEVPSVENETSLPSTATEGDLKEVKANKKIYKYEEGSWKDQSSTYFYGNTLINKAIDEFETLKEELELPEEEVLDYSDMLNYIGSINYSKLGLK